jgi:hypothetical protein
MLGLFSSAQLQREAEGACCQLQATAVAVLPPGAVQVVRALPVIPVQIMGLQLSGTSAAAPLKAPAEGGLKPGLT